MAGLTKNWWLLVLRGIAAILFGVLTVFRPDASLATLVLLFGVYAIVEGCTSLALAFMKAEGRVGTWILHGIVGIGAGLVTFAYPALTAVALYSIIAAWAILTGIVELVVASKLRRVMGGIGPVIFAGIVSILFGVLLIALPVAGVVALVTLISIMALMSGVAWLTFGMQLHRYARA